MSDSRYYVIAAFLSYILLNQAEQMGRSNSVKLFLFMTGLYSVVAIISMFYEKK